jgi:PQQ-like domain
MHALNTRLLLGTVSCLVVLSAACESDWPQLQRDAARTGRSPDEIGPPYRARWLWFGNAGTLRNRDSKPNDRNWTNDLTVGVGKSYPLPSSVPLTLAGMMQPIVYRGLVLVASLEGKVYAIDEDDGSTAWEADLPGGSLTTGVAVDSVVVFCSVKGAVHGFNLSNGHPIWSVQTGKTISGAPCAVGERIYVANHSAYIHAINASNGQVEWKSEKLGGIVQGSLAATPDAVYVGAEDMKVYKLNARDGKIAASQQVYGQSFRLEWPVVHNGKLWVRTAPVWCVGSEGVNDDLLSKAVSLADEETKYLDWLDGKASYGSWTSMNDWKTFFALNLGDLAEPFHIPCGPSDGCGQPPDPPAIDRNGNVVSWWPTRFCALTLRDPTFGTRYFIDLAAVDQNTGRRKPFDAGKPVEVWPLETDNLYGLSTGGRFCYWRQRFRGTYAMDLEGRSHVQLQVEVRERDGGTWNAPVMYANTSANRLPRTPSPPTAGHVGATIANHRLYLAEDFGVTAIEHVQ